jgi:hypothetical protein
MDKSQVAKTQYQNASQEKATIGGYVTQRLFNEG